MIWAIRGEGDSRKLSCIHFSLHGCYMPPWLCVSDKQTFYCLGKCASYLLRAAKFACAGSGCLFTILRLSGLFRTFWFCDVWEQPLLQVLFVSGSDGDNHISGLVQRQQQSEWLIRRLSWKFCLLIWTVVPKPAPKEVIYIKSYCSAFLLGVGGG